MENTLSFSDIEEFNPPVLNVKNQYWQKDSIWNRINKYPEGLKKEFKTLQQALHIYLTQPYTPDIQSHLKFEPKFLKKFSYKLSKTEKLEMSFFKSGGIETHIGFEYSKYLLHSFFKKYPLCPFYKFPLFANIKYYIRKGALKRYDITHWIQLYEQSLENLSNINMERYKSHTKEGLNRAKKSLRHINKKIGRIPRSNDNGCNIIHNNIKRGYWHSFGIYCWSDLLRYTFGDKDEILHNYTGIGGINNSKKWFKEYFDEYGTIPPSTYNLRDRIQAHINNKDWAEFGITSWSEFVFDVCGIQVNETCKVPISTLERLIKVKSELMNYFLSTRNLPTSAKFPYYGDLSAKGKWKDFGINSWNELIFNIFNTTN